MQVAIDGLNLNYTQRGQGDYVFLLHGWGASAALYEQLAQVIAEKYTVVCLDFPGFGGSDEPPRAWDVSDFAHLTRSFIQHFGCDRVILLGHSFGGRVIIKLANDNNLPFLIEKIVLTGSAGILPKRTLAYHWKVKTYKLGKKITNISMVQKLFPDLLEKIKKKAGSADYANASERMRQCLVKAVNEDLAPLLPTITPPTLLIWGENDTATPLSDGQRMERLIPGAGLVVLKNAGHYAFLEQSFAFHQVIKSFLQIGD